MTANHVDEEIWVPRPNEDMFPSPEVRVPVSREELVRKVRAGWPDHGSTYSPLKNGFIAVQPVRDGGIDARLIDFAVDTVLANLEAS